jgi:hypothetical protein
MSEEPITTPESGNQPQGTPAPDKPWYKGIINENLNTPEAEQVLSQYKTVEDALVGGLEAKKAVGRKLENVIQKPVKGSPAEEITKYQKTLLKELGAVETEEELADVNFAEGLPEGAPVDETLVGMYKKFAIENGIPKSMIGKNVAFYNQMMALAKQGYEKNLLAEVEEANKYFVEHYGSEEEVAKNRELVKRMFRTSFGLSEAEYEQVGTELADTGFIRKKILGRILMDWAKEKVQEDSSAKGQGGGTPPPEPPKKMTVVDELSKTSAVLGWKK